MHPALVADEIVLFRALLSCADRYVEFGTGGSTVLAADHVRHIISVDSSAEWLAKVEAACAAKPTQPRLVHVDIGPTKEWGYPADPATRDRWPDYHGTWHADMADADLFLMDGRFRAACFLQALLRCRADALLVIHDYGRPGYHIVERFARPVARARELAVFQRRLGFNPADAAMALVKQAFEPE